MRLSERLCAALRVEHISQVLKSLYGVTIDWSSDYLVLTAQLLLVSELQLTYASQTICDFLRSLITPNSVAEVVKALHTFAGVTPNPADSESNSSKCIPLIWGYCIKTLARHWEEIGDDVYIDHSSFLFPSPFLLSFVPFPFSFPFSSPF